VCDQHCEVAITGVGGRKVVRALDVHDLTGAQGHRLAGEHVVSPPP
jgi:hypothetical protein